VSFDPYQPYGPVVPGSSRVVSWNVWGRFGDWVARQDGLIFELKAVYPDIICLQESWETEGERQADVVGDGLGLNHRFAAADWSWEGWRSGAAVLAAFVAEVQSRRYLTVVCGDFNAGPDSDEIRLLNGRSQPPVDGLVFYDAWEIAGDGGPGFTWANSNPLAGVAMLPDRRIDYIFTAWPRRGSLGHPLNCRLLGANPLDDLDISDHYGIYADLRY